MTETGRGIERWRVREKQKEGKRQGEVKRQMEEEGVRGNDRDRGKET